VPIEYEIAGPLVLSRARGIVIVEDILAHMDRLFVDSHVPIPYRELYDTRASTEYDVSSVDLRSLGKQTVSLGERFIGGRVAMVADGDLAFGLGRMFEAFTEKSRLEFRVFREPDEARAWLLSSEVEFVTSV
jgi:hypothetical protein